MTATSNAGTRFACWRAGSSSSEVSSDMTLSLFAAAAAAATTQKAVTLNPVQRNRLMNFHREEKSVSILSPITTSSATLASFAVV
jgi:hypothetical protein